MPVIGISIRMQRRLPKPAIASMDNFSQNNVNA
jgi:hypothetical protein